MQEGGQLLLPFLPTCEETLLSVASSKHSRWHTLAHRCSHGGTSLRGNPEPRFAINHTQSLINRQCLGCTQEVLGWKRV